MTGKRSAFYFLCFTRNTFNGAIEISKVAGYLQEGIIVGWQGGHACSIVLDSNHFGWPKLLLHRWNRARLYLHWYVRVCEHVVGVLCCT